MNFGGLEPVTPGRIRTVCEQLADARLIAFKSAPGGPDGSFVGMSKISGHGCDVVDGLAVSRIVLEFPQTQSAPASGTMAVASPEDAGLSLGAASSEASATDVQSEVLFLRPTLWARVSNDAVGVARSLARG